MIAGIRLAAAALALALAGCVTTVTGQHWFDETTGLLYTNVKSFEDPGGGGPKRSG
jgi:hypothetical protein